jgi:hypothetical protein
MTNYQLGKIYKIVCNTTGLTYYGSTCEPTLARRLAGHIGSYRKWKNGKKISNISSHQIFEIDDYVIVLVELFPCDSNMELHQRERYHIENNDCVNKVIPTRTREEYNLEHPNRNIDYYAKNKDANRAWFVENKVKVAEYKAAYAIINKNKIAKQRAEFRANNKERLTIQNAENYRKKKELKANQTLGETVEG